MNAYAQRSSNRKHPAFIIPSSFLVAISPFIRSRVAFSNLYASFILSLQLNTGYLLFSSHVKMGPIVRLLGSGIGLASEARAASKQKKAEAGNITDSSGAPEQGQGQSHGRDPLVRHVTDEEYDHMIENGHAVPVGHRDDDDPTGEGGHGDTVEDEEDWELDEAEGDDEPPSYDEDGEKPDVRKMLAKFLTAHPMPTNLHPQQLPCPVIIPQRRPRTKSRGFVRAYAPVLAAAGIDQDTWMDFLKTFEKASAASPIFAGILVAGHLIGYIPSVSAMVAAMTIQTSAIAAIVVQSRSRTNTFLDDVNEHFFRPRGLYALLIEYKGSRHRWSSEPLDISHAVTKGSVPADAPREAGTMGAKFKHNLQFGSGKSHGEAEMPASAPLIYPALDEAAERRAAIERGEVKPSKVPGMEKMKEKTAFADSYMDRRSQAVFRKENPQSSLNVPSVPSSGSSGGDDGKPQFASRYADPTHPASSGSLISLLTGGHVDPKGMMRQRDQRRKDRKPLRTRQTTHETGRAVSHGGQYAESGRDCEGEGTDGEAGQS